MLVLRAKFKDMVLDPYSYRLIPGGGYVNVGPIRAGEPLGPGMYRKRVLGDYPRDLCNPPPDAQHKSWHTLQPPGGPDAKPIAFQWLAGAKQYMRIDPHAHRMGFPPAYLSSHGWTYKARGKNELV